MWITFTPSLAIRVFLAGIVFGFIGGIAFDERAHGATLSPQERAEALRRVEGMEALARALARRSAPDPRYDYGKAMEAWIAVKTGYRNGRCLPIDWQAGRCI